MSSAPSSARSSRRAAASWATCTSPLRDGERLEAHVLEGDFTDVGSLAAYVAANRVARCARGGLGAHAPGRRRPRSFTRASRIDHRRRRTDRGRYHALHRLAGRDRPRGDLRCDRHAVRHRPDPRTGVTRPPCGGLRRCTHGGMHVSRLVITALGCQLLIACAGEVEPTSTPAPLANSAPTSAPAAAPGPGPEAVSSTGSTGPAAHAEADTRMRWTRRRDGGEGVRSRRRFRRGRSSPTIASP